MDGGCQLHKDIRNEHSLTLGQVSFVNCLPIDLPIEHGEIDINTKIIRGVPSKLNQMILRDEIDVAPVSSITYLENKNKLQPIADLCIASNGPADSVLLFSKFPIEELNGAKIGLSPASATSNKLLQVILKEFYNLSNTFGLEIDDCAAKLLIGDAALIEYAKQSRDNFIYDLGSLWKKHTGLPMVFALWAARKEVIEKEPEKIKLLSYMLNKSKDIGLSTMFEKVIKKAQENVLLSDEFYKTYFEHLSYEFTDEFKKGLNKFEEYAFEPALK